jgi:hypothetical protein
MDYKSTRTIIKGDLWRVGVIRFKAVELASATLSGVVGA